MAMSDRDKVLKRETAIFLVLALGLTYLLNVGMISKKDFLLENQDIFIQTLQVEMMIPAFSAIFVGFFVSKNQAYTGKPRIFFIYYLLTATFGTVVILGRIFFDLEPTPVMKTVSSMLVPGTVVLLAALHLKAEWRVELRCVGLEFGRLSYYLSFGALFAAYFLASGWLNLAFRLANPPCEPLKLGNLVLAGLTQIVVSTALGFLLFFGEEFGWRIFLQDRLTALYGRTRGVLLVGAIWGLWHAPAVSAFGWTHPSALSHNRP
jgi:membrane protease YdiL (CAAX protease family)